MPQDLSFLNEPCHSCGTAGWERIQRNGFLEKKLLPLFNLYPWRCPICNKHRYVKLRSDPRIKHYAQSQEHPLAHRHSQARKEAPQQTSSSK